MTKPRESVLSRPHPGGERNGTHAERDLDVDRGGQDVSRSKFDLGHGTVELPSDDVPWGYGEDRVTALPRDPDWLFVYWELTDDALDQARKALGKSGLNAWCSLRIHDVTGLALEVSTSDPLDIAVDRDSRDWFVHVGKPGRTVRVELGLKGVDGGFRAIASSDPVEFPRKRPSENTTVRWLEVQATHDALPLPTARPLVSRGADPESQPAPPALEPSDPIPGSWEQAKTVEFWETARAQSEVVPWTVVLSQRDQTIEHLPATRGVAPAGNDPIARVLVHAANRPDLPAQSNQPASAVCGPWRVTIRRFAPGCELSRSVLGSWSLRWVPPGEPIEEPWGAVTERVWLDAWERDFGSSAAQLLEGRLVAGGTSPSHALGASRLACHEQESPFFGASELRIDFARRGGA